MNNDRFNTSTCNDVAVVMRENSNQSSLDNGMVGREQGKNYIALKDTDNHVEPFSYPLLLPTRTFLKVYWTIAYPNRPHITRL